MLNHSLRYLVLPCSKEAACFLTILLLDGCCSSLHHTDAKLICGLVIVSCLMFLNKYQNKRRLGKGAYGDVHLVEDDNGEQFALKLIEVRMIEDEPHLREYLDGEIECMKSMDSPYIIKLYETHEDEKYIYLVLEYCDGGDLINYQAKLPGKVFGL